MGNQGHDLRYGELQDYRGLFAKLKRDAARFEEDPSADNLFNVMVTGWSLADWLVEDLSDRDDQDDLKSNLKALVGKNEPPKPGRQSKKYRPSSNALRWCEDIANSSKHARIRFSTPEVTKLNHFEGGFGEGPFGIGPFSGGAFIGLEVDGEWHEAGEVVQAVIAEYEEFLLKHDLL